MQFVSKKKDLILVRVEDRNIFIHLTNYGELKLGGEHQVKSGHMGTLNLKYTGPSWYHIDNSKNINFTIKVINEQAWCNIGKSIDSAYTEFPFLFLTKLEILAIEKQLANLKQF